MPRTRELIRTITALAAVLLAMMTAPAAALAIFTNVDRATSEYSAASIPAPATANVTMVCQNGGRVTITVNSNSTATYANYHEIKIYDRSGSLEFTGDLSKSTGRTYSSGPGHAGNRTYEIRGSYKVPGTTNTWTGNPLNGVLSC
ncbi:hypothetical protein [Paenarthrobacter ureafaciens]|uniref:hypothetical protein n=1 Tax=Paenarthrobacter ureafaciens TaxID=37931 RepID=UPI0009AD26CA|nr:hypothetical protein [Paenarthrobacter ureafaciens]GLU59575.1 hypothetical protein Pure01_20880 [Paenarthrobacter ureafaciens]GLU63690.1 hypothetical protein Pure02_19400 [Paenarthrobacter ureafaciens]GLU68117.1 hypothetical protein Pure03_20930 [Paenarthrobacter ureafaciens]GLU72226.1 hypothetical protein Pure04_19410 [Paenarthrobacter ureafaciens]GLU76495.1 hypothetical protein Pure05_19350 [Paenarthrobacter ureafaciens]